MAAVVGLLKVYFASNNDSLTQYVAFKLSSRHEHGKRENSFGLPAKSACPLGFKELSTRERVCLRVCCDMVVDLPPDGVTYLSRSLLGRFLSLLALLLRAFGLGSLLLDAVQLLNHESSGDSV